RDALRGVDPHDWDIATSATPDEIQKVFRQSLYLNRFGTVIVRQGDHEIEVTTYRIEADYADHRHPTSVAFTDSLHEDLSRRDFTMNAMAWRPGVEGRSGELVDPFGGQRTSKPAACEPAASRANASRQAHCGCSAPAA